MKAREHLMVFPWYSREDSITKTLTAYRQYFHGLYLLLVLSMLLSDFILPWVSTSNPPVVEGAIIIYRRYGYASTGNQGKNIELDNQ